MLYCHTVIYSKNNERTIIIEIILIRIKQKVVRSIIIILMQVSNRFSMRSYPRTLLLQHKGMIASKLTHTVFRRSCFYHCRSFSSETSREMASYLKPKLRNMSYEEKEKFVRQTIQEHSSGVLVFSKTY